MKLLLGTPGWGWNLFGLVGKNAGWFIGFSRRLSAPDIDTLVAGITPENSHDLNGDVRPFTAGEVRDF